MNMPSSVSSIATIATIKSLFIAFTLVLAISTCNFSAYAQSQLTELQLEKSQTAEQNADSITIIAANYTAVNNTLALQPVAPPSLYMQLQTTHPQLALHEETMHSLWVRVIALFTENEAAILTNLYHDWDAERKAFINTLCDSTDIILTTEIEQFISILTRYDTPLSLYFSLLLKESTAQSPLFFYLLEPFAPQLTYENMNNPRATSVFYAELRQQAQHLSIKTIIPPFAKAWEWYMLVNPEAVKQFYTGALSGDLVKQEMLLQTLASNSENHTFAWRKIPAINSQAAYEVYRTSTTDFTTTPNTSDISGKQHIYQHYSYDMNRSTHKNGAESLIHVQKTITNQTRFVQKSTIYVYRNNKFSVITPPVLGFDAFFMQPDSYATLLDDCPTCPPACPTEARIHLLEEQGEMGTVIGITLEETNSSRLSNNGNILCTPVIPQCSFLYEYLAGQFRQTEKICLDSGWGYRTQRSD